MKLYYFRSRERALQIISTGTLWFSSPYKFNDPFEFGQVYSDVNIKIKSLPIKLKALKSDILTEIKKTSWLDQKVSFRKELSYGGVCCFSKKPTSIAMWSHYAENHYGVCLEFDFPIKNYSQIVEFEQDKFRFIKIKYKKTRSAIVSRLSERKELLCFRPRDVLSEKSKDWCHEQEIRICTEKRGAIPVNRKWLTKIIFGVRCPEKDRQELFSFVRPQEYSNCVFEEADCDNDKYEMITKIWAEKKSLTVKTFECPNREKA